MIFAIGDVADPAIGLPYHRDAYVTNPDQTDPKRAAYELYDPHANKVLEGMYAVGWARKASDGLVGIARHDGEVGAAHVLQYLEGLPDGKCPGADHILGQIERKGLRVISKEDLECLARAEEQIAQQRGISWFKFDKDEDMMKAIEAEKAKTVSV
jgi:ferredoxin--NADP+ reductase